MDWTSTLISTAIICGLFFLIRVIGYYIEKFKPRTIDPREMKVSNFSVLKLKEENETLWIGGNRLVQSQIESLVKTYPTKKIELYKGETILPDAKYATYENGKLLYESTGKEVVII